MAYDSQKGLVAIATSYSGSSYQYEKINFNWIQTDSINSTPDQITDLDTYTNGDGYLKRTVLPHTRSKWEANTSILFEENVDEFIRLLQKGFGVKDGKCNKEERHLRLRYFNEWQHGYEAGHFYVPDITFSYKTLLNDKLVYQPIRFAFIEY